jgi:hypothetical protein
VVGIDAGGAAGAGGAEETIAIEVPELITACTGSAVSVELSVSGGRAPYDWEPLSAASGFALKPGPEGKRATLLGTPMVSGEEPLVVSVTDSEGHEAERRFTISTDETPVIRTDSVPSVCPNEVYSFELTAEGGDASEYVWSTTDLSEQTGLALVGNRLEGRFAGAERGTTSIDFTVNVAVGHCRSASAQLTLDLESPTATVCPAIEVSGELSDTPPPSPCLGNPYSAQFLVRRGKGVPVWEAPSRPAGLAFDADTQTISGNSVAPGTLTVRVKDETERTIEASYELHPRDKCWFAYVSSETDTSRVHLFDPVLGNRRTFPEQSSEAPALDFKFSPNGQFLAYRLGAANEPAQLAVVKLATWQEQLFDFPSVKRYAWANDSSVLAVVFDTSEGSFLGGLAVARAEDGAATGAQAALAIPRLDPIAASVDSEPAWFGDTHLGFLTVSDVPSLLFLATTQLGASGFTPASVLVWNSYTADTVLRPAAKGLFAIPQLGAMVFYGSDGSVPVLHDNVSIAPSGRYAARTQNHELQLFRDIDSSFKSDALPRQRFAGCDTLLGWASGRERVACTHRTSDLENELWIVDIDPRTDVPRLLSSVRGNFAYPEGAHAQRRRLFSKSGARFAFTTDDFLHVARLDEGTPIADFNVPLSSAATPPHNAFAELSFSPNELLLLQHRGARLSLFDLRDQQPLELTVSDALSPSERCEEDFRNTSGWCGVERSLAPFTWAPGSDLAAFQTALGTLEIYDLTWLSRLRFSLIPVNEQCGHDCIGGEFAFQPLLGALPTRQRK